MPVFTEDQLKAKLIIDPPYELRFCGPFDRHVVKLLKLTNPSTNFVLFKIKTTAPKRYCVRSNFGCVKPRESVNVEIVLQPFEFDPYESMKHKFMVQSVFCPPDDKLQTPFDYMSLWKEIQPEQFMDAKLKCVFEMPIEDHIEEKLNTSKNMAKLEALSAPEMKSEEKISNIDTSEQSESLREEIGQLRDEKSKLKWENINLKEEIIRLRLSQSKPVVGEPYTPVMAEKQIPTFFISIAIAAAIFGILLGKLLL